jgi:hypothetical protein
MHHQFNMARRMSQLLRTFHYGVNNLLLCHGLFSNKKATARVASVDPKFSRFAGVMACVVWWLLLLQL